MRKNYIIFFLLCLLILPGWFWVQSQLWPVREKEAKQSPPPQTTAQVHPETIAALVATPSTGLPGLVDALSVATTLAADRILVWRPPAVSQKMSLALRAELGPVGVALAPPGVHGGWVVFALEAAKEAAAARHPAQEPEKAIVLGGPDYYIQAVLTTRGGGVRRVTLTKFQAADREGRPVYNKGPQGKELPAPLELVQDDPDRPSFLFYHYAKVDAEAPVVTLGERIWKLEEKTETPEKEQRVRFSAKVPGYDRLTIERIYTLKPKDYHIGLTVEIKDGRPEGQAASEPQSFRYQLAGAHGLPIEGEWYTYTYRNAIIGMVDDRDSLWRELEDSRRISVHEGGERVPAGPRGSSFLQYAAVVNQYFASAIVVDDKQPPANEGGGDRKGILAWARPTLETKEVHGRLAQRRPGKHEIVLTPIGESGKAAPYELLPRAWEELEKLDPKSSDELFLSVYEADGRRIAESVRRGSSPRPFLDDVTVRVNSEPVILKPGEVKAHRYMLYHGPVKVSLLGYFTGDKAVESELVARYTDTLHLRTFTDYRSDSIFGTISQSIRLTDLLILCTNAMHWLLNKLQYISPNEGLTIILLTVLVRGAMFPISKRQAQLSLRMQELAPEMKKLQEKYKNDPQARTQAMMELYRVHKVNPLGGCLPLFLQMPIFLGLYWALQESITFRLAHFLWIDNLAAPDMLFRWGEWIPMISNPDNLGGFLYLGPFFNVLPLVAVGLMLVQQTMMMPPPADEQQAAQQRMMKIMMVVFALMFYKVAAGLCLYFIASSLWGLAERKLLPKKKSGVGGAVPAGTRPTGPAAGGKGIPGRSKGRAAKKAQEDTRFQKVRDWWNEILKQAKKK